MFIWAITVKIFIEQRVATLRHSESNWDCDARYIVFVSILTFRPIFLKAIDLYSQLLMNRSCRIQLELKHINQ